MANQQSLSMRLWLAGLAHNESFSPRATQVVFELMRNWLQEIKDDSTAKGCPLCLIDVAIGNLDDEIEDARARVTSLAVNDSKCRQMYNNDAQS